MLSVPAVHRRSGHIAKLERIRRQWEEFFAAATETRMRAEYEIAAVGAMKQRSRVPRSWRES